MTNKAMFKKAHAKAHELMRQGCGCYAVAFKLALKECYAEHKAAWAKPTVEVAMMAALVCLSIVAGVALGHIGNFTCGLLAVVTINLFTLLVYVVPYSVQKDEYELYVARYSE